MAVHGLGLWCAGRHVLFRVLLSSFLSSSRRSLIEDLKRKELWRILWYLVSAIYCLLAQTKSLVRDEGADQALVEPLGPNATNVQN